MLIKAQNVSGKAAKPGKNAGVCTDSGCVFSERYVANVMRSVFDVPMGADGLGGLFGIDGAVGEVVTDFTGLLPYSGAGMETLHDPLEPDDGHDNVAPGWDGDDGAGVEDRRYTGFVAVALTPIHGLAD